MKRLLKEEAVATVWINDPVVPSEPPRQSPKDAISLGL